MKIDPKHNVQRKKMYRRFRAPGTFQSMILYWRLCWSSCLGPNTLWEVQPPRRHNSLLHLPVYQWRDTSQRGWSWALSRAQRCPKQGRTGAFYPPVETFCLGVCRGCLPPWDLSAASPPRTPSTSLRRFDWSSRRGSRSPVWSRLAGRSSSSPCPERTLDALVPPCLSAAPSPACPVPPSLSDLVGENIIRKELGLPDHDLACRTSKSRSCPDTWRFYNNPYMRTPARATLHGASWSADAICALLFTLVGVGSASVRNAWEVCVYLRCAVGETTCFSFIVNCKRGGLTPWNNPEANDSFGITQKPSFKKKKINTL